MTDKNIKIQKKYFDKILEDSTVKTIEKINFSYLFLELVETEYLLSFIKLKEVDTNLKKIYYNKMKYYYNLFDETLYIFDSLMIELVKDMSKNYQTKPHIVPKAPTIKLEYK